MTTKRVIAASEKMATLNEGVQPGADVTEMCKKHNIGSSTHYKWKRRLSGGRR